MNFDVYRMRINPNGAEEDADPIGFCEEKKVVGLGHEIYTDRTYDTFEKVKEAHRKYEREHYDNWTRFNDDEETLSHELRYVLDEMDEGDYVWVNRQNDYYLCRITSDWRVAANVAGEKRDRYLRNDIHNFREADWEPVEFEDVPGFIRRTFSMNFGSLSRTDLTDSQKRIVDLLFEGEYDRDLDTEEIQIRIESTDPREVLDLLGPEETEDLVLLYLQSKGWKIVGSSMSMNQAEIECELRKEEETAYVQVKSGSASVDPSKFVDYSGTIFLFVGTELDLDDYSNTSQVSPSEITDYLTENIEEIPSEILSEIRF